MNTHSGMQLTPGILTVEVTDLIDCLMQQQEFGITVDGHI
jgi:hypothetical protein